MNYCDIRNGNLLRGAIIVPDFSGTIPQRTLQEGDIFTLPVTYEVLAEKICGNTVEFILVQIQTGEWVKFYPTMLTRTICTTEGLFAHSSGSAVDVYKMHLYVSEGMRALAGRSIKVTRCERVASITGRAKNLYQFDFVD